MSGETHFGLNLKIEIESISGHFVRHSRSRIINKLAGIILPNVGGVADEVTNE